MNDMKEFLDSKIPVRGYESVSGRGFIHIDDLGLFFWGRGGKQFVVFNREQLDKGFNWLIRNARNTDYLDADKAQDFLDALACIGENKIKEKIKELQTDV